MIEIGRLYKRDSIPLEEVIDKEVGTIYYNVEGHGLKYIGNDEFEFVQGSPLVSGELITDLNDRLLSLFWTLRRNDPFYKE